MDERSVTFIPANPPNIPSPTSRPIWSRECVRKMLCNEKYAGAVTLQKTCMEDFFSDMQKKNVRQLQQYLYKNTMSQLWRGKF